MCLLYVYVIRQGPNQYPSCALTWIRTSLVQCTPRGLCFVYAVDPHLQHMISKFVASDIRGVSFTHACLGLALK
jgi:hypothetical protein